MDKTQAYALAREWIAYFSKALANTPDLRFELLGVFTGVNGARRRREDRPRARPSREPGVARYAAV